MENGLIHVIDFDHPKIISTIKATIAVDATDEELALFIEVCKATGLNPFKKELWFIKTKRRTWWSQKDNKQITIEPKLHIMTGVNGFFAIANRHPAFDGMEPIEYEYNERKELIAATARVHRKDRKYPSVARVLWSEYEGTTDKGNGIWDEKPHVMLAKVAKTVALREAFPQELNNIYGEEELARHFRSLEESKSVVDRVADRVDAEPQKVQQQKADLPLQIETRNAIRENRAYCYDKRLMVEAQGEAEARKDYIKALRECGAVAVPEENRIYCSAPIQRWNQYLIVEESKVVSDDIPDWAAKAFSDEVQA
jgi:phage recombination protein Bet